MRVERSEKRCCKCGQTKPVAEFSRDKRRRDGLCPRCKQCAHEHYIATREEHNARSAAHYATNREAISAQAAAYRAANREEIKARKAAEYAAHREKYNARSAAYYAANREEANARSAAYYAAHREEVATRDAAYHAANREKILAQQLAHRTANRDYLASLKVDGCRDCGVKPPLDQLHWHHLDPATKLRGVAEITAWSRKQIDAEVAKCVLVCVLCHTERHRLMRLAQKSQ